MIITVPQRKNLLVSDLVFKKGDVSGETICEVQFLTIDKKEVCNVVISEYNDLYTIESHSSIYENIAKLIINTFFAESELSSFNNAFYNLQKRLKEAVRKEETPIEDEVEVEVEVKVEETPIPKVEEKKEVIEEKKVEVKKQVVEVKIDRPNAVGLEGQIHELVYNCLESEYTVQTIQNKMIELGIEPNRTEIIVKRPDAEPKNVGAQHKDFKTILQTISAGVNTAIVGPAGSGKTTCVHSVANALGLPFYSKSVSAQTGVHEFFGYQDANGNYVRTLFREAYEYGGVFLLDEFDAGNPNVLASMNQATANGSCAFADKMIEKHENFIVVMAGNTYGHGATSEYVGRNSIDKATLDRFAFIFFDYDEDFEYSLATNKSWCKTVQGIRKKVFEKKVKTIVSPRATFDGAKLLSSGMDIEMVKKLLIYKGLTEDEINLIK